MTTAAFRRLQTLPSLLPRGPAASSSPDPSMGAWLKAWALGPRATVWLR